MEISEPNIILLYHVAALKVVLLLAKKNWDLYLPRLDQRCKLKFKILRGIWQPVIQNFSRFFNGQGIKNHRVHVVFASIHKYVLEVEIVLMMDDNSVFTWRHKSGEHVEVRQALFQIRVIFSHYLRRINQ